MVGRCVLSVFFAWDLRFNLMLKLERWAIFLSLKVDGHHQLCLHHWLAVSVCVFNPDDNGPSVQQEKASYGPV